MHHLSTRQNARRFTLNMTMFF
ncbi:hypothetical protein F383_17663 [Gossypium arboreum]|uniref:Uncharacterized protein n=1 Tax=Gossypium arboreum TaxID=29729 RepID=A0A0B0NII2_GOSAR|nr:hypothetical protein F383_17663 [Gossypium arboreum]